MALPPRNTPRDYELFMNQYLANLNHDIQNQTLVYNAVSANLSGDFADVPQMPQDMRSVEEKLRDIDSLKIQLRSSLMSLTDGPNANEIVKSLSPELIQMAIQSFPSLYQTLKPIWSQGVPSVVFIKALENLTQKQDQTAGIDFGIQQSNADGLMLSNDMLKEMINGNDLDELKQRLSRMSLNRGIQRGLLDQISYVKGLITDRGDLADRIIRAREVESMTGEDLNIPDDPSVINLVPTKAFIFNALDQLDYNIQNGDDTDANNTARNILEYLTLPDEAITALQEFNSGPIPSEFPNVGEEDYAGVASNKPQSKGRVRGSQETKSGSSTPRPRLMSIQKPLSRSTSLETGAESKSGSATPREKAIENALARRQEKERIQALKEQEQAKEGVLYDERQKKGLQAFKSNVSRARAELPVAQVEAVQSEEGPIIVEGTKSVKQKGTKAIEIGSFEEVINDLTKRDSSTRLNTLKKLAPNGNEITFDDIPVTIDEVRITGSGNKFGNPQTQGYWERTNIYALYKKMSGKGIKTPRRRTMSGRGVSFNIKEDEEAKPSPKKTIKLNIQGVIEKEPSYVPFGRYAINKHRLAGDILMLRTPKNGVVLKLPTQKISNKLSKIITTIANKGVPSFEAIGELDNNDKEILHKILQECHITNISTPNPSRDKSDDMYRRFVILKGEIVAGNNNPALAKELKRLIIVLMGKDLLPKREGTQALVELALLEM